MMPKLTRMEGWITRLVEEPFVRLFAKRLLPQDVAQALARALEDAEERLPDGRTAIPGTVQIFLHPDDWMALRTHLPAIDTQLTQALAQIVQHADLVLNGAAEVQLQPDSTLAPHSVRIAFKKPSSPEATERLPVQAPRATPEVPKAWLLLSTGQSCPLTQAFVRIGRALDNDLILDDPRVSRYHAHLRLRYGRYLLQDAGSSGGTLVNGYPIEEVMLRSGDLISLGGYTLIFTEGDKPEAPPTSEGTRPMPTLRSR